MKKRQNKEKKQEVFVLDGDSPELKAVLQDIKDTLRRRNDRIGECLKALQVLAGFLKEEQDSLNIEFNAFLGLKLADERREPTYEAGKAMADMLIARSAYRFPEGSVEYFDIPCKDGGDPQLGFRFNASVTKDIPGGTKCTVARESFVMRAPKSFDDAKSMFDSLVGGLRTIRFERKDARKKEEPKEKQARPGRKHGTLAKPPAISLIKEQLLLNSKYRIPNHRLRIVADHVDKKSRKWVYELRFFQKDCTHHKDQPYEPATFRVSMKRQFSAKDGAKRFDKVVENLRFNTFEKK